MRVVVGEEAKTTMAAAEGTFSFSVASVVEDVLQQHGNRHRGLDLESRRAEEAGTLLLLLFYSSITCLLQNFPCFHSYFDSSSLRSI